MGDADQVIIGVTGRAYIADLGATFPVNPFVPWGDDFTDLGYITTDGLEEALGEDRTEIDAWGEDSPVITRVKKRTQTFKMTFLETSAATMQLYYALQASEMNSSGAGTGAFVEFGSASTTKSHTTCLGIDLIMDDKIERVMIARSDVTDRGSRKWSPDDGTNLELTFTALTNPSGGKSVNRYTNVFTLD